MLFRSGACGCDRYSAHSAILARGKLTNEANGLATGKESKGRLRGGRRTLDKVHTNPSRRASLLAHRHPANYSTSTDRDNIGTTDRQLSGVQGAYGDGGNNNLHTPHHSTYVDLQPSVEPTIVIVLAKLKSH